MSKSFLQRFQGKTQLVSKTGVQNILGTTINTNLSSTNNLSKNYLLTCASQTNHRNRIPQECSVYIPTKSSLTDTHFSSQAHKSSTRQSDLISSKKQPQPALKNQENIKKDQKFQKCQNVRKWSKLGGLGANIGGEQWQKRKSKMQKMQAFSGQVKSINYDKIKPIKQEIIKERQRQQRQDNCRTKGLEYSKKIAKPNGKYYGQSQQEIQQCIEPYDGYENSHKIVFNC